MIDRKPKKSLRLKLWKIKSNWSIKTGVVRKTKKSPFLRMKKNPIFEKEKEKEKEKGKDSKEQKGELLSSKLVFKKHRFSKPMTWGREGILQNGNSSKNNITKKASVSHLTQWKDRKEIQRRTRSSSNLELISCLATTKSKATMLSAEKKLLRMGQIESSKKSQMGQGQVKQKGKLQTSDNSRSRKFKKKGLRKFGVSLELTKGNRAKRSNVKIPISNALSFRDLEAQKISKSPERRYKKKKVRARLGKSYYGKFMKSFIRPSKISFQKWSRSKKDQKMVFKPSPNLKKRRKTSFRDVGRQNSQIFKHKTQIQDSQKINFQILDSKRTNIKNQHSQRINFQIMASGLRLDLPTEMETGRGVPLRSLQLSKGRLDQDQTQEVQDSRSVGRKEGFIGGSKYGSNLVSTKMSNNSLTNKLGLSPTDFTHPKGFIY